MFLYRLIYCSQRCQDIPFRLEELAQSAWRRNKRQHITGALWTTGNYIVQVLEGDRAKLSSLYEAILRDNRHYNVQLCFCDEIEERRFENWHFGLMTDISKNQSLTLKYAVGDKINPYEMRPESLLRLLCEMTDQARVPDLGGAD